MSAKLRFVGVAETMRAPLPDGCLGKQSFQDKRVTKLEPVVFGIGYAVGFVTRYT